MIAPIQPEPEENASDADGSGQGDYPVSGEGGLFSDPTEIAADVKLMKRAVRSKWPVRNKMRLVACDRLRRLIECDHLDPEQHVAAIKALGYLDSLNIKREHGPTQNNTTNNVNILNTSIESLLAAPAYVQFLESRDDLHSGTVCPNGDAGQVLPAPAHPGNLNGNHGHHHGKN